MILVLNRQRLLNGNRWFLIFLVFIVVGCNTSKSATQSKRRATTHHKVPKKKKKNPKVITLEETKSTSKPPITDEMVEKSTSKVKSAYRFGLMLPLKTSSDFKKEIYIQYYLGMKLAAEKINNTNCNIEVEVIDPKESMNSRMFEVSDFDVIIAPNDKQMVEELIQEGKRNEVLIVSPWYSNSKITKDNPYYLQLRPNLKEHFNEIIKHVSENFKPEEVALVGLENGRYKKWFKYFQEIGKAYYMSSDAPFYEHYVEKDSLALGEYVFRNQIEEGINVYIVPNYSFKDENHVYSVFRKLNAEKGLNEVHVYGLPMVLDSDKINFDFYNSLNLKVPVSEFLVEDNSIAKSFKNNFYHKYHTLPTADAYEGHDLMSFLVDMVDQYGNHFPSVMNDEVKRYLQSTFHVKGVDLSKNPESYLDSHIDYYENDHIDIIEFKDGRFRRIEE